jgi:drug/metabolite transporter (DMT)-like permease
MASVIAGLAGGLAATIVMTVLMMVMGEGGPPPTAALVSKVADGEPEDYAMPGMVLHVVYGIVAGAVFAVGAPVVGVEFESIAVAIGVGLLYGIVLMIGGMVFWMRAVIGMEPDRGTMVMFGTVHVVYGVVLGAFLGADVLA